MQAEVRTSGSVGTPASEREAKGWQQQKGRQQQPASPGEAKGRQQQEGRQENQENEQHQGPSNIIDESNSRDANRGMDARNFKDVMNIRMIALVGLQKHQDDSKVWAAPKYSSNSKSRER